MSRPNADDFINEIIFDRKCNGTESNQFYRWCIGEIDEFKDVGCRALSGTNGIDCIVSGRFWDSANNTSGAANATVPNGNKTVGSADKTEVFHEGIEYKLYCLNKANQAKSVSWPKTVARFKNREEYSKAVKFCRQELYGLDGLPLWMVILIILAVLIAVTIASYLFWRFYLRKKLYGKNKYNSLQFTSAPLSSTSHLKSKSSSKGGHSKTSALSGAGSGKSGAKASNNAFMSGKQFSKSKRSTLAGSGS